MSCPECGDKNLKRTYDFVPDYICNKCGHIIKSEDNIEKVLDYLTEQITGGLFITDNL